MAICITGCATVKVKDNLVTLDKNFFTDSPRTKAVFKNTKELHYDHLIAAYNQIHTTNPHGLTTSSSNILASYMETEPLITKIVDVSYNSLIGGEKSSASISKKDIEGFITMIREKYGAESTKISDSSKTSKIIKQYLTAYYSGKTGFIDREGTVYKKPKIKNSIGNDVITAVVAISLEAIFDGLLKVPVYMDLTGAKFETEKGAEPTAYTFDRSKPRFIKLVAHGADGICEHELKAIRLLSGLAADQSKTLSGMAFRAFGDLEIGFAIAGHFSFGDNDTLAKILDTTFEISSKRIVEAGAYEGFKDLTIGDNDLAANQLLEDIQ